MAEEPCVAMRFSYDRCNITAEGSRKVDRNGRSLVEGWVARTRPLAGPLSPRGPQPIVNPA